MVGFISNELTIVTMNDKCYNSCLQFKFKLPTSDGTQITAGGPEVLIEGFVPLDAPSGKNIFVLNASTLPYLIVILVSTFYQCFCNFRIFSNFNFNLILCVI